MRKYIVTDLTRFQNGEDVCTAVIDINNGECARPMPYLKNQNVKELNIHPGAVLEGEITKILNPENPHVEDASWKNLKYIFVSALSK